MLSTSLRYRPENLRQIIDELPRYLRGEAVKEASAYLVGNEYRGLRHYPAERPGQTYVRTFQLRYGWTVISDTGAYRARVLNAVTYAPYVQGDNTQAWMHRDRWQTVSGIVASNESGMIWTIGLMFQRVIKEKGL